MLTLVPNNSTLFYLWPYCLCSNTPAASSSSLYPAASAVPALTAVFRDYTLRGTEKILTHEGRISFIEVWMERMCTLKRNRKIFYSVLEDLVDATVSVKENLIASTRLNGRMFGWPISTYIHSLYFPVFKNLKKHDRLSLLGRTGGSRGLPP